MTAGRHRTLVLPEKKVWDIAIFLANECFNISVTETQLRHLYRVLYGLFVPRTIRTLYYSYYGWTIRTLDDLYDGLRAGLRL